MAAPPLELSWRQIAALPAPDRIKYARQLLEEAGLAQPQRIAEAFSRLLDLPIFVIAAGRVAANLTRAGSPERAILAFEDAIHSLEAKRGDASPLFVDPILGLTIELTGASGRAARLLATDPALAIELGARMRYEEPAGPVRFAAAFQRILAAAKGDTESLDRLMRRYRNRQMLAIALRELREADVRQTAQQLADLASAALGTALIHHRSLLELEIGRPDPDCDAVIFGMGKLGGRELNFSSDIDLMYFYEHDEGRAGALSLHELFVKLFERTTVSIGRSTEHGFVFRVDLDLRPEGKSGAITNSLLSAERYYETWGRTWERAAWIKGRPVAGSDALGARILDMIRPFVYRRSFDLKAIEEIFRMKGKIDLARNRARPTASPEVDLKLGVGGIREIEFFVQAYQLLHGGRDPRLQQTNTLEALQQLEASGLVSARTRELLADAYLFLRKVEHRVQIVEEQQTHSLPSDPEALQSIARSLGFSAAADMVRALADYMGGVHEVFNGLIGRAQDDEPIPHEVELLTDPTVPEAERLRLLEAAGASDPATALANLGRAAVHPRSPFHPHAESAKRAFAQRFLAECLASPNVDRAVKHLADFFRALILHGSYLEGLSRPALRRGVARVLGASDLLARILVSNPALLPQVLLGETLPSRDALERDLKSRLEEPKGDLEQSLNVLRAIKQEETLRTAMADLAEVIDAEAVGERLSTLAEILIPVALELAEAEAFARYGAPYKSDGTRAELAIVAGGTLGAREMGYRSDVDLSVIYEGGGETSGGERAPITNAELFTRIAQRLLSFLTMRTPQGDLYPADMRLRPSGSKGTLVVSFDNFETYHQKTAQLWERQALVRARTIAGSPALRERVDRAIADAAYGAGPVQDGAQKIHEMRVRMERERSLPFRRRITRPRNRPEAREAVPARLLDLKLGRGGLIEAEFLVQYLLIQHGGSHPEIRSTSTRQALAKLGDARILPTARAHRLIRAIDRLRSAQNWVRLAQDAMIDHVDLRPESLRPLALAVGYQGERSQALFERDLLSDTGAIHLCYTEVLGVRD